MDWVFPNPICWQNLVENSAHWKPKFQVQFVPMSSPLYQGEVNANLYILNYGLNHLRFSKIWGIPVFTTSGMNSAFRDKSSEYSFLTCLAGDYLQLGAFIKQFLGEKSYFTSGVGYIFGISADVESYAKFPNPQIRFSEKGFHSWYHVTFLYDDHSDSCSFALNQVSFTFDIAHHFHLYHHFWTQFI